MQANPGTKFSLIPPPYGAFRNFNGDIVYAENIHRSRNQAIVAFNQRQKAAYNAGTHIPWKADRREHFSAYPGSILPPSWYHREFSKSAPKYGLIPKGTFANIYDFVEENPKDLFDWFEDWAELINMKNKEMKAFMKSPWFKVAGLTPKEAKAQGIRSGQNSFRAIIRMRKKLGLTGPKDYVDYRKPRLVEDYYAKAIDNWSKDDWEWCKAQVRFNKRHSGFPYNDDKEETKGPLIKKQKTQNQPSKRLLGLWVWAHDPWRWARKKGIVKMPKCPNVPWVGMTEKRKYGKIEVIDGPKVKNNPKVQVKKDEYRSYFIDEEGNDLTGIPFEKVTLKEKDSFATFEGKMTKKEANKLRSGQWYRVNVAARPSKEPIIQVAPLRFSPGKLNQFITGRTMFFNNLEIEGPVYPLIFTQVDSEPSSVLLVQGEITTGPQPPLGILDDISDWQGNVKGSAPHFESGRIRSEDKITNTLTFAPENGRLRVDMHLVNQTKSTSQNMSTITITDEGDHYFLHEVQVAPKFRRQGYMTATLAFLLHEMPDRLPGHPKKPIRTLVRAQEGIPQEKLLELFERRFGFRKLEEVDGGVLMEFNWPVSTIANPPKVTTRWGDREPLVLDENLQYKTYTGNTKLPFRMPYQLVKHLRSLLARDREYAGFAKNNKLYYGTSFGIQGVSTLPTNFVRDVEFYFHTHPFGFRKGMQGVVSPQDMRSGCFRRIFYGIDWQLVVQKRGINIIKTSLVEDSDLHKAMMAGNKEGWKSKKINDKFDKLLQADIEIILNAYKPGKTRDYIYGKEIGIFHPNYHDMSELKQEVALINTLNKFVKGFKFDMWYLEVPSIHLDWTKEMSESYPLDDSKFEDVADWIKAPRQIRANPHYTPAPGIAMFPGELHQGPAALYQQTISISQLNPPRSKPFPWNKERVKLSPFKTMKRAKATYKAWKEGKPIGFTANSSLKSMGKIPRASGKYELGEKYERINPHGGAHRIPKKYEGQPKSEHSDLFDDEDKENTIQGLGFKDKATAIKSVNIIKRSGKTHAHKIQAAMAMEQRARFHAHQTPGIKAAQKVYAKFIEEMKKKTKARRNPKDCPPATQDLALNTKNRDAAVKAKHIQYGPLNLNDKDYWERYAKRWNTTAAVAKKSNCSNCIAFDISPRMKDCMPGKTSDKDGELGYCWMHHFKCHSARSCYTWAAGGPISKDKVSFEWQERAFPMIAANPRTKKGRKFPSKYLKGLTPTERAIARYEIDRGYEYSMDDPAAYKDWKSDIKAKARGLKTVPSKWRNKFAKKYGQLKKGYDFLDRIAKTTGVKRKYLKKIQDKGLAAWRVGHRPGVTPMQWARGRVYAFVMAAPSSTGPGKPDHKLAKEAGVR